MKVNCSGCGRFMRSSGGSVRADGSRCEYFECDTCYRETSIDTPPPCRECGGALVDERGSLLPCWEREHPRCVRCNNAHVRRNALVAL